eukprot:6178624-Pleurochrysis_carterae.AAC.1
MGTVSVASGDRLVPCRRWFCRTSKCVDDRLRQLLRIDHNQTLGRWYALYAGWTDAPLRGEWVRAPEP